ncbi:MAG TPA: histidine kinase [Solirubrobacteraceae bacterium]
MRRPPSAAGHGEALAQLASWVWWLRALVLVVVAAIVLSAHGTRAAAVVEIAIGVVALAGWWACGRLPASWGGRLLLACLTVLAAVGGFAATSHHETSVLALAMMGMLAAGFELPLSGVAAVLLAGVLAVEIGAVSYGDTELGVVLGYPALLAALAIGGRYRRAYRIQAEQAEALVVETRRAQLEAERAAALTERSRIAREIHDVLAHSLGALGIQLQAAEAMLSERGDLDSALLSLARAQRLVQEGLTETRRAVRALRSDTPPLPQALAALVGEPDVLTVTGEPYTLGPAAGLALLRVAQEAVANARKHAGGHPVTVTLDYTDGGVEIRVENLLVDAAPRAGQDDPAAADSAGGYGLAGMHERLRLIDGELSAGPAGDRWLVCARVARSGIGDDDGERHAGDAGDTGARSR